MPKSRSRKRSHHRRERRSGDPRRSATSLRLPGVAPDIELLQRVNGLERAGDVVGALELVLDTAFTQDGRARWTRGRIMRLLEIDAFGPRLPPWAWARWVRAQALDGVGHPDADRLRAALADADRAGLSVDPAGGGRSSDDMEAQSRLIEHDWVFAQSYLYTHGGLRKLLPAVAPDVLGRAIDVASWCDAGLGAFRLLRDSPATITWLQLGTEEEVQTLNLGTAATLHPGDHVIGRRVTCGAQVLFEGPPLAVPEAVATAVARRPDSWVTAIADGAEGILGPRRRVEAQPTRPSGLLTDLPDRLWEDVAYGAWEAQAEQRLRRMSDEDTPGTTDLLSEACVELVIAAMDGRLWQPRGAVLHDPWPAVAAALQRPGVSLDLVLRMVTEGRGPADIVALGHRVGGFARTLCGVEASGRRVTG